MPRNVNLIATKTLAAAETIIGDPVAIPFGTRLLSFEVKLVVAGGGTSTKVYFQTTLDGGATWIDIACLAFTTSTSSKVSAVKANVAVTPNTTPTDGTMTDNQILDGLIGDRIRARAAVVGTYTGASSLTVVAVAN